MLASAFSNVYTEVLIYSILSFNIIVWYGKISSENKIKLVCVIYTSSKLSSICNAALKMKATQILDDSAIL